MADSICQIDSNSAEELVGLWRTTFADAYADVHSAENIEAYASKNFTLAEARSTLADKRAYCAFYLRNSKPVGYYLLLDRACPIELAKSSCELRQLYVLAEVYRSRVGSALLDDCMGLARELGSQTLWLDVADTNHRAKKFYTAKGFVALGAGPVLQVGTERLNSTIMARDI